MASRSFKNCSRLRIKCATIASLSKQTRFYLIDAALQLNDLPPTVRKNLENLYAYLSRHKDHIDYARFKELGLPIGSGMVETYNNG